MGTRDVAPAAALLGDAVEILAEAEISNPRWVAEQLLAHRLGRTRAQMLLEPLPLTDEARIQFLADAAACAGGMPMQYVMGTAPFYGREFAVGPGVFIPRPETEGLVEQALKLIPDSKFSVLDVGTGSGAIAVTVALERPRVRVTAVEKSPLALAVARRNARRWGAEVTFVEGDLLAPVPPGGADFIIANLPYLDPSRAGEWPAPLRWEPWLAQDGGEGGTELIRRLIGQAPLVLAPGGWLLLEIGETQAREVTEAACVQHLRVERVIPDLAGRDRGILLRKEPAWND